MTDPGSPDSTDAVPLALPPLSQLGAITGRFIHDLANEISCAATVMTFLHDTDTETLSREDLDELNASLTRAISMIHEFGAAVRTLRPGPEAVPFSILRPEIENLFHLHKDISHTVDPRLDSPEALIICRPDWLLHCVNYVATFFKDKAATVAFSIIPVERVKPPVDYYPFDKPKAYFEVKFSSQATFDLPVISTTITGQNLNTLVIHELMRHMHGFQLSTPNGGGVEFGIYLCLQP